MAVEVLQELDLSQSSLCQNGLVKDLCDLLDGHLITCVYVSGCTYDTVGSSTQLSQDLVGSRDEGVVLY